MARTLENAVSDIREAFNEYKKEKRNGADIAAVLICESPIEEAESELAHALRRFKTKWKDADLPADLRQELQEDGFLPPPMETVVGNLQTALANYKAAADNASMAVLPWTPEKKDQRSAKAEVNRYLKQLERLGGVPSLSASLRADLEEEGFLKPEKSRGRLA